MIATATENQQQENEDYMELMIKDAASKKVIIRMKKSEKINGVTAMMTEGPPKGTPPSGSGRFTLATQHPVVMALARQMVIQVSKKVRSVALGLRIKSHPWAASIWHPVGRWLSEQICTPMRQPWYSTH